MNDYKSSKQAEIIDFKQLTEKKNMRKQSSSCVQLSMVPKSDLLLSMEEREDLGAGSVGAAPGGITG